MTSFLSCKQCGSENLERVLLPDTTIHYAKLVCKQCGSYVRFLPKPKEEVVDYRRAKNKGLLKKIGRGYCWKCLRTKAELPPLCTLEAHHIIPVSKGGTDDKENLLELCSDCHKSFHHAQKMFESYRKVINY